MNDETRAKINELLADDSPLLPSEQWAIRWQFGMLGDFQEALVTAIARADEANLLRLHAGFPLQVEAFTAWHKGDLGVRLRKLGLDL
jgi:hypothetical protein